MQDFDALLVVGLSFLGIMGTVAYYFARFYFNAGQDDPHSSTETQPQITETQELTAEDLQTVLKKQELKSEELQVVLKKSEPKDLKVALKEPVEVSPKVPIIQDKPKDLKDVLSQTKSSLFGRLKGVFSSSHSLTDDDIEELEEVLYTSDLGPRTVSRLMQSVYSKWEPEADKTLESLVSVLKLEMQSIFSEVQSDFLIDKIPVDKPYVLMIVGVNGAGKTTTIGKLSHLFAQKNLKTMVVAGDTYRAAAQDQLKVWSERSQVELFSPEGVKDPSAVAYDAINFAKSKNFDVVILDTAGRLHTQDNLMEELKKIKRVVQKVMPEAPHEILIVLDANSGQNALIQTEKFNQALGLTGAVLTKLDGTAKGGVAVGLACEYKLPIKAIGVGEKTEDLRGFNANEFVDSIL